MRLAVGSLLVASACGRLDFTPASVAGDGPGSAPRTYGEEVLADQPLGYWPLDDLAGDTADASGHAITGTVGATVVRGTPGAVGNAMTFDGNSGILLQPMVTQAFTELTLEAWVNKASQPWETIVEREIWDNDEGFGLYADYLGTAADFGHYNGPRADSMSDVEDSQWHHVVGTMTQVSPGTFSYKVYVDGRFETESTGMRAVAASPAGDMRIAEQSGTWRYTGAIDEVALYDRALSPERIAAHYAARP